MAEHPIMTALRDDPEALEALLNRLEKMLAAAQEMNCTGLATMWPEGEWHGLRIGWVHPSDDDVPADDGVYDPDCTCGAPSGHKGECR